MSEIVNTYESRTVWVRPQGARRVRQGDDVGLPFMPYGLIPLTGFVVVLIIGLWPFAVSVERTAERTANQALAASGAAWASASASGQWVRLEGAPPTRAAVDQAVSSVRVALAPAQFGLARPVTRVIANLSAPGSATGAAAAARSATPPPPVTAETVRACDTSMAGLLGEARVEFATGSATVSGMSSSLLDSVAQAVGACPGVLLIEGHTDDVGERDMNWRLSLARAEAVRAELIARGVPPDRLVAEGRAASRPVADNNSEDGRGRNRRIEIRVLERPPAAGAENE